MRTTTKYRRLATAAIAGATLMSLTMVARADAPGRGRTAAFEREFLQFIIDHHYGALRITELAAGTDTVRDATISPAEGTSPSPEFGTTPAKSGMDQIKSMARRANRVQREEILDAARMLREWYGIAYQPRLRPDARAMIDALTARGNGSDFDQAFLTMFPRHHFTALTSSVECLTGRDVAHDGLARYCRGILEGQLIEIDEMRHMLCARFNVCDSMPFDTTTAGRN